MSNLTKGQLAAENAALRNELNTVRSQRDERHHMVVTLEAEVARLRDDLKAVAFVSATKTANLPAAKPVRPAYVMPQWQVDRAAAMAEAKAIAMATNRSVKV